MVITRAQGEAPNLIEGIISLLNFFSRTLIDPSALHSFISEDFIDSMVQPFEKRQCELVVEVPSEDLMLTTCYLDDVPIMIQDWLEAYGAVIDCQKKRVRFNHPGGNMFEFKVYLFA
ncbi:hypothetical protein Taro_032429 [Colocasia esculenta]|uniref:Uncharacterized protein n=1 Tax=Colocasia esculenta TaxID=4460 RepID=A0A843VUV7_COLES|nr:hypothetical protein [Colocasia esculenta]